MRNILFILPLLFLSCSVFQKSNTHKEESSKSVSTASIHTLDVKLGAIGSFHKNMINKEFQTNAFPVLKQKVRVSAILRSFDKSTLKRFKKVKYFDSLHTPPKKYFTLKIIDKVTFLDALNAPYNKSVFEYLRNAETSFIVNNVSIVFNTELLKKINSAEEIFLISNKNNDLILELYINEEILETIHFTKGEIFNYQTAHFCWSENDKHKIEITDISANKCTKNSYNTYNKALKEKEDFKF